MRNNILAFIYIHYNIDKRIKDKAYKYTYVRNPLILKENDL